MVRTDGRAAGGVRSRDYQIFWDGSIYLPMVLRYKRKMQLYLQKRLRIDACPAVLFQNRDNCFSLLCFLPCLDVHIITFFFSSFLSSFSPFFRLFFFLFHLLNFMARQISKASAAPQTKYFPLLLDQSELCWLLVSCCFFFWGGGGEGGNTRRFCTLSDIIHHTCQERLPIAIVTWCYNLKKANDAYLNQSLDDF